MSDVDVVVVGAGPVGLSTALGLARSGIRTVVLDRAEQINASPRAMAYLHPVLPALERFGVLADMEAEGVRIPEVNFIDMASGQVFTQSLDVLDGHFSHPYTVALGQGDVGKIFIRHLAELPAAEVRWSTNVVGLTQDDAGVDIVADTPEGTETIRARWVVAADGAGSTVRERLLGVDFPGFTWPNRFIATNIRYDFVAHGLGQANYRLDSTLGAVIAKIDRTGLWRYAFRESDELPLDSLEERIHEHFTNGLYGGDYDLVQFAPYRVHQRCADSFRHGRVLLAGDAAHVTNPAGGLGLTGGFLDAIVLAEALAAVVQGQTDDSVLDAYADQRRRVWLDFVSPRASGMMQMLFHPPGPERDGLLTGLQMLASNSELSREQALSQCAMVTPSVLPVGVSAW